jgi:hypothetical protein
MSNILAAGAASSPQRQRSFNQSHASGRHYLGRLTRRLVQIAQVENESGPQAFTCRSGLIWIVGTMRDVSATHRQQHDRTSVLRRLAIDRRRARAYVKGP